MKLYGELEKKAADISLQIDDTHLKVKPGTPLFSIAAQFQKSFSSPVVGARLNNEVVDLYTEVAEPGQLEWLDLATEDGMRIYRQSLVFLLTKAAFELFPHYDIEVKHSLGKSYYCEIDGLEEVSHLELMALEAKMRELVEADEPIIPQHLSRENAVRIIQALGYGKKATLLEKLGQKKVVMYSLGTFSGYSYSVLAPGTGALGVFRLEVYARGFLLRFPSETNPAVVSPYPHLPKLGKVFRETKEWASILGIEHLVDLMQLLEKGPGEVRDLIHVAEALHEKSIAYIADEIFAKRDKIRLILIAGPSSSGKTTFAYRLGIQLRVLGLRPVSISMDDYFVNREQTPRDEKGDYDFEALEAIDLELFNRHLQDLIGCQEVECPVYNFHTGHREFYGRKVQVDQDHPIIIEGIHGLNEKLTASIKRESKYKIYISALAQINIDSHNRIPTTDARLIRRIVRDSQFRSHDALATLKRWPSVRRGEERNIFPYQEEADVMFNSALLYELCVLKKYAEPLLRKVGREEQEYSDARRLLSLLDYFPTMSETNVPLNSILREFIGGSSIHGS